MIDEENDDEEILKRSFTLKSILKNLLVIFFILLGALFIYLGGFSTDQWYNIFIGLFFMCIGTTIMQIQKQPPEPIRQTLTILVCGLCGLTKVRNFEQGDYVFLNSDNCDKCNKSMEIKQIYSVKLKKPTEPSKPKENLKLEQEVKS